MSDAMWKSGPLVETWDRIPNAIAYLGSFCHPDVREALYAEVLRNRAMFFGVDESGWPLRDGPESAP